MSNYQLPELDYYTPEPQVPEAPAYPAEEVLRLIRQARMGPPPEPKAPGFLDRLAAGLQNIQAGSQGRAGDVFGANLLAGFGQSFGGSRMAARDQALKSQMDAYEREKAAKQEELGVKLKGVEHDFESRRTSAAEAARSLSNWRKEKREWTERQATQAKEDAAAAEREKRRRFESDRDFNLRSQKTTEGPSPWDRHKFRAQGMASVTSAMKTDPEVQNFIGRRQGYEQVKASASANSAAGDLALIYGFVRLQDPNAVKEGEFRNVEDAQGKLRQFINLPSKWRSGNRLNPEFRKELERQARRQYEAMRPGYNSAIQNYNKQAEVYDFDPALLPFKEAAGDPELPTPGGFFDLNAPRP